MIENNELPGLSEENRWAVHIADQEIVRLIAEKAGLEYDPEDWSYKVVHPTELEGDIRYTLVMAKKDIPEEDKPSALVLS